MIGTISSYYNDGSIYMNKKTVYSSVAAGILLATLSGCQPVDTNPKAETNTTKAVEFFSSKKNLTTIVKGLALDDAGFPIAGATVTLGTKTTVTNSGGQYQFNDVSLSHIQANVYNITEQSTTNEYNKDAIVEGILNTSALTITITPRTTDNLTTAVVEVKTSAIFTQNIDSKKVVENTFGLITEAETAIIPHTTGSTYGTLRNTQTGRPVPNAQVTFKLAASGLNGTIEDNISATNGSDVTLGITTALATTDANGSFQVSGLLTGSKYDVDVPGWTIQNEQNTTINTTSATNSAIHVLTSSTNSADLDVTPIAMGDDVDPTVAMKASVTVAPWINTGLAAGRVMYARGIDGTAGNEFVVTFSEALDPTHFEVSRLFMYDTTNKANIAIASATLSGNTLTIQTSSAVALATQFEIRMNRADMVDVAGNFLADDNAHTGDMAAVTDSAANDTYLVLDATTYTEVNTAVTAAAGAQQVAADNVDLTQAGYANPGLQTHGAYEFSTTTTLANINNVNNTGATQLANLANAIEAGAVTAINSNVAKITYTAAANTASYKAQVLDANDNLVVGAQIGGQPTGTGANAGDVVDFNGGVATNSETLVDANGAVQTTFYVDLNRQLQSGDKVRIYAVNSFGDESAQVDVAITDNVAPTTVLNVIDPTGSNAEVSGAAYSGTTGDLVDQTSVGVNSGLPYFAVSARMLEKEFSGRDFDLATGALKLTEDASSRYTAADYTSWANDKVRTVGVRVSEPLSSVGDVNSTSAGLVTSASYVNIGGQDLIAATVSDIIALQHENTITATGMTDTAGNANSSSKAAAKVVDYLPPLIESGSVSGTVMTLNFNEAISLTKLDGTAIGTLLTLPNKTFAADAEGNVTLTLAANSLINIDGQAVPNQAIPVTTALTNSNKTLTLTVPTTHNFGTGATSYKLGDVFADVTFAVDGTKATFPKDYAANGSALLDFSAVRDAATNANNTPTHNSWDNQADGVTVPTYVLTDSIAPTIQAVLASTGPNNVHVYSSDASGVGTTLINTAAQNDGNDIWETGDTANSTTYKIAVKFRDVVGYTDSDGNNRLFGSPNASISTGGAGYSTPTLASGTDKKTVVITFDINSGTAALNDAIQLSGVQDASGNTLSTAITITLQSATSGVAITGL